MQVHWLDSGLGQIATTAIGGYQKYLSPHKGFSCAHRLLHGGKPCSEYVKGAIAENGLFRAIEVSRERFVACKEANQILRARYSRISAEEDDSNPQKKKQTNWGDGCATCACSADYCSLLDCSHCGTGLDCGAIDCGGADCGGCSW